MEREEELAMRVDGYELNTDPDRHYYSPATSQLLKSLTKLEHERQLQLLASQMEMENNVCVLGTRSHKSRLAGAAQSAAGTASTDSSNSSSGSPVPTDGDTSTDAAAASTDKITAAATEHLSSRDKHTAHTPSKHSRAHHDDVLQRPLIIIIRHGKTEHNKLGLFTGTEIPSLDSS